MDYEIGMDRENGRRLAVAEFDATVDEIGERIGLAFATVGAWLARHGVAPSGPACAHYRMNADGFHVRAGFGVSTAFEPDDVVHSFVLPESRVLVTTHVGPYSALPDAYDAVRKYAADHGLDLDELTMWEEYLTGPESPPEQTVTRIVWPVRG